MGVGGRGTAGEPYACICFEHKSLFGVLGGTFLLPFCWWCFCCWNNTFKFTGIQFGTTKSATKGTICPSGVSSSTWVVWPHPSPPEEAKNARPGSQAGYDMIMSYGTIISTGLMLNFWEGCSKFGILNLQS